MSRTTRKFGFWLALILSAPAAIDAQTIDGRLVDEQTGRPVVSARVTLLDADDNAFRTVFTEADGAFSLPAPLAGRYTLRVARIGYVPMSSPPLDVRRGETVEIELRLSTSAVPLEPLVVVGEREALVLDGWLVRHGFYDRRSKFGPDGLNSGQFLERADIEQLNPFHVTDVLRSLRGVWSRPVRSAESPSRYRTGLSTRTGCKPTIFLNGFALPPGLVLDELLSASHLVGVEVYTSTPFPARYMLGKSGSPCAVILVWTG